jgi:membrane protease subunit (stomatin/prohibitin family)
VGTDGSFETSELETLMRSIIAESFADLLATEQIPALDLARSYREMGEKLNAVINERIDDEYGLEVPQVFIVNISLPEEVEKALDTRTKMGVIGDMNRFQQFQMGQAMTDAAQNPAGGGMGDGMGMGMGFAMAHQMANQFAGAGAAGAAPPPPPPQQAAWYVLVDGAQQGPMSQQQLAALIGNGTVQMSDLVWSAGMPQWAPAAQVPQLASSMPPPPPPPPPVPGN